MKLTIVWKSTGLLESYASGHVCLFAEPDPDEHYPKHNGKEINKLFLVNYRPTAEKTLEFFKDNEVLKIIQECKPDDFITLHSNSISYLEFCKAFLTSEFKDGNLYHNLKRNCVTAVRFGLEKAGFKINFKDDQYIWKHVFCCFWCPTKIITPKQLLNTLKEFEEKIKSNKSVPLHLKFE